MKSFMLRIGRKGLPPERIGEAVKTALTVPSQGPLHRRAESVQTADAVLPSGHRTLIAPRSARGNAGTLTAPAAAARDGGCRSPSRISSSRRRLDAARRPPTSRSRSCASRADRALYLDSTTASAGRGCGTSAGLSDDELAALLDRPATSCTSRARRCAGRLLRALRRRDRLLRPDADYIGRRIGPWLLDRAIERGFARGAAS
jgi:hypothetical protein